MRILSKVSKTSSRGIVFELRSARSIVGESLGKSNIGERERKGGRRSKTNGDLESRSTPTDLRPTKVKYYEKPREKNMSSLSGLHCREDVVNYAFNSGS